MSENTSNFIFNEIDKDIENGVYDADKIMTRFPPEPNGYLHIGHAKALWINFAVKEKYNGITNLRFDDTNPVKEDTEYTESIMNDIKWLGFEWDALYFASHYFEKMYDCAIELINKGLAYVDDQTPDEIKENRGSLTKPGIDSPYRNRSVEENLDLFTRMKDGEFPNGAKVLRAKIDMQSPNMNMRDPVMYRILHTPHHNIGDKWCIYPMYDFAHPIEDAIENITHSLCSGEYEDHRPLYDWVLDNLDEYKAHRPRQIEFARLALTNVLTSKRYIKLLVEEKIVDGWDDPRLYTLGGLRRRGVTPEAIKEFIKQTGVAKANSVIDKGQFEYFVRDDLMKTAPRIMVVTDPVKVEITNYPEGEVEYLDVPVDMSDENSATRKVPFSREIYVERDDFMEVPAKKYHRLYPGNEVRLMGAYFITCTGCDKDENGNVTKIYATYDPETKSGSGFTGRKVKGTIHWVSAQESIPVEIRNYDDLLEDGEGEILDRINKDSLHIATGYAETSLNGAAKGDRFQFIRQGFYVVDTKHTTDEKYVFNRTVTLKSSYKPAQQ
ncbi:MAG: glutamine--tRNA ligase/YqeY domain fusion protein [Anaerofustis stercorihominis]|nr:glutamine--tRNA ligase/YqeY domain fusion protein [Anaerofustis stercorihominis]